MDVKSKLRRVAIVTAYKKCHSYAEVARSLGVTRERVRQIVTEEEGTGSRVARKTALLARAAAEAPKHRSLASLARALGVGYPALKGWMVGVALPLQAPGHGSYKKGCRCEGCTKAHREEHARWRKKSKPVLAWWEKRPVVPPGSI